MATAQCEHPRCRPKMLSKLSTDRVTVLVADTKGSTAEFSVHSDLLGLHSGFFRDELAKPSSLPSPGNVRTVSLSGQPSSLFKLFVTFLYTGCIYSQKVKDEKPSREWKVLARLWKLGEALSSTTFKDATVDAMMHKRVVANRTPWPGWLEQDMLQHLTTQSGLQKFLVDMAVAGWPQENFEKQMPIEGLHFFQQIIIVMGGLRRKPGAIDALAAGFNRKGNCKYHDHGADSPCYRQLFPIFSEVRQARLDQPDYRSMMIELHVGSEDDHEEFVIQKDRAVRHSKIIQKALDPEKGWKESKEGIIRLPEDSPRAVEMFGVFIDTGHLHIAVPNRNQGDKTAAPESQEEIWALLEDAWLLGEHLLSTEFKDAVVDELLNQLRSTAEVPKKMHEAIYGGSVGASGMRRLLVDLTVFTWFPDELGEQRPDPACAEYFKEVAVAAMKRHSCGVVNSAPFDRADAGCSYHDHGKDIDCYKTMFKA